MAATNSSQARASLKRQCNRLVSGHPAPLPQNEMLAIADWMSANEYDIDNYGSGKLIADFEAKVATLLGKPAAVFMPSGKMASLIALRIWADRAHNVDIGMHRTAHLELHEEHAYKELHGLRAHFLGKPDETITAKDLKRYDKPLSAVVIELPMREIGGRLPAWDDLVEQRNIASGRSTKMHLDGARLWEALAFYKDKSYADITALFDSVYVSFYKGIGGLSGAMLLGDEKFIADARVWLTRHGGTIYQQYPLVASAAMRFDSRLARMQAYYRRALALAEVLGTLPGVTVTPAVPQANLMHLRFSVPVEKWEYARDHLAASERIWLGAARTVADKNITEIEIYVGEGLMNLSDNETITAYQKLLQLAGSAGA
ncbi:MAG: beta-eliminating lyase-related protein [Betaproteobacteria bacterium]